MEIPLYEVSVQRGDAHLEHASLTVARNSQPSSVGMYVASPIHSSSSWSRVNRRRTRSAARTLVGSATAVRILRRPQRPCNSSRIEAVPIVEVLWPGHEATLAVRAGTPMGFNLPSAGERYLSAFCSAPRRSRIEWGIAHGLVWGGTCRDNGKFATSRSSKQLSRPECLARQDRRPVPPLDCRRSSQLLRQGDDRLTSLANGPKQPGGVVSRSQRKSGHSVIGTARRGPITSLRPPRHLLSPSPIATTCPPVVLHADAVG